MDKKAEKDDFWAFFSHGCLAYNDYILEEFFKIRELPIKVVEEVQKYARCRILMFMTHCGLILKDINLPGFKEQRDAGQILEAIKTIDDDVIKLVDSNKISIFDYLMIQAAIAPKVFIEGLLRNEEYSSLLKKEYVDYSACLDGINQVKTVEDFLKKFFQ